MRLSHKAQDDSGLVLEVRDGGSPYAHSTLGSYEDPVKQCV